MSMLEFGLEQIDQQIMADSEMKKLAEDDPTEFDTKVMNIYREFGYRPDGSPLPFAQRVAQKTAKVTGLPEGLIQAGMSLPVPIATTAISAAAGTIAGGPGAGTALGAMFGSLAGEEMNVGLGITEPLTTTDQAIAMGAPLLGPLASRTIRGGQKFLQRLPGAQTGVHELATETFESAIKKLRVNKTDVEVFRNIVQHAPDVRMKLPMLENLLKAEQKSAYLRKEFPGSEAYIDVLNKFVKEMGEGPVSMKKILEWERGANMAKLSNPTEVWGKMAGTILDDMDAAVSNPKLTEASRDKIKQSADAFRKMVQVTRKYNADEMLTAISNRVITRVPSDTSLYQFNKKQFLKEFKDNRDKLEGAFSSKELDDMVDAVEGIGHISSKAVDPLLQKYGVAGAAVAGAAAVVGTPLGTTLPVVILSGELLRQGLMHDYGRKTIKYLTKQRQGVLDLADLDNMLGQIAAGVGVGAAAARKSQESPFRPLGREQ